MFDEGEGPRDGDGDTCVPELKLPPGQVVWGPSWGCVWKERTVVEGGEHGLHVGEVSMSCWDNQSGVL